MAKLRKMLGSIDSPYIISLMKLIETQSKSTITLWCMNYAKEHILPIYQNDYPSDTRLEDALNGVYQYLKGELTLSSAKKLISEAQKVAREIDHNPAAQAAARAVAQSTATINTPTSSLSLPFYGSAAIAYNQVGLTQPQEIYDRIAEEEFIKMEQALRIIAVENEEKPAKINWNC